MKMIVEDVSKLTTIPASEVQHVVDCILDCICYNLQESIKTKDEFIDIDIGVGILSLNVNDDTIEYKFIPSTKLENDIKYTLNNNCCPLIIKAEERIRNKIMGAYKEFF